MEKSYKEIMPQITTFIFDVDGVLTDGTVTIFPNGELIRSMNTKDGYALKTAVDMGFNVCIITGGTHTSIKSRLNRLGINDIYLGSHNKIDKMVEYLEINKISAENVLYMGDDIPDIPPMQISVLPTCPKDAVQEVQNISKYVSQKRGGKGCVRDVIEQVLKVQDKWNTKFDAKYD